jgi:hypothetical protein
VSERGGVVGYLWCLWLLGGEVRVRKKCEGECKRSVSRAVYAAFRVHPHLYVLEGSVCTRWIEHD